MAGNIVRTTNFTRPTLSQLRQRAISTINDKLPGADAMLRNSVLNVLSTVLADLTSELYGYLDYIADQIIIDTASDEYLDRWGLIFGITRKMADFSTGSIIVTGAEGSQVLSGTIYKRSDDTVFIVTESVAIPATGSTTAVIKAQKVGVSGNTSAGAKLLLSSPIAGVVSESVVGELGLTGGSERESNESYRDRILLRIQEPSRGGSQSDWVHWTLEISGVTRAWCYPLEMGLGTVGIRFMMDNTYDNGIPQAGDVARVYDYLNAYDRKPVTADVFVNAPIPEAINITIQDLSKDTPEVRQAIWDELLDLFNREAYPGCLIYMSKIWEAISIAAGVEHFTLIQPTSNIQMQAGVIPILNEIIYREGE